MFHSSWWLMAHHPAALLARARHTNDAALAPATVCALQSRAHHLHVACALDSTPADPYGCIYLSNV